MIFWREGRDIFARTSAASSAKINPSTISDAPLASDLRVLIRKRLVEGDTDQEVISYLVSRYGDFVLLTPPVKGATLFLWFGPVVFALLGMLGLVLYFRRQKALMKRGDTP